MYKAYRVALEALRREFQSAGDRHPGLFYEGFALPDVVFFSDDPPRPVWEAFIAANRSGEEQTWEEWHLSSNGMGCGRFYGEGSGVEVFKRLAESVALVLYEMGESSDEGGSFLECLEAMLGVAADYPTPLLRAAYKTWGIEDDSRLEAEALKKLHEEMATPRKGEHSYPVHPMRMYLVHDVFTSAVAFIDTVLDPDGALLVGGGYTDKPPISVPEPPGDESEATESPGGGASAAISSEQRNIFRRTGRVWEFRFPTDDDPKHDEHDKLPHSVNFERVVKLLRQPGVELTAEELIVEGSSQGKTSEPQAHNDGLSVGATKRREPHLSREQVRALKNSMEQLKEEIALAEVEPGEQQRYDALVEELAKQNRYYNMSVGRFGRSRLFASIIGDEKARTHFKTSRNRTIEALRLRFPCLAQHLEEYVKPVRFEPSWCYRPPSTITWLTDSVE